MFNCSMQHGLQQAARVISGELEQGSRECLERGDFIKELHSEMRLRPGVNESGAAIERKECEELQPSSAALLVMVDDRLDSDAVPEDAHQNQGQSLCIIQTDRDNIDEG